MKAAMMRVTRWLLEKYIKTGNKTRKILIQPALLNTRFPFRKIIQDFFCIFETKKLEKQ